MTEANRSRWPAGRVLRASVRYLVMVLVAVIMVFPFYYSLVTSLRPEYNIVHNPVRLFPEVFTGENYLNFFTALTTMGTSIGRVLWNTFSITGFIILTQLFTCALSAYSLARLNYRGKGVILKIMYASMMIPGVVTLVPSYGVVSFFGISTSKLGIMIPAMYSIYGVLFLRSFFLATPAEVAEAARIDGGGEFRIFVSLYLRMIVPGLITLGLFTFNGNWNSYLWPSIILQDKSDYVLAVAIKDFQMLNSTSYGPTNAAAIVTVVPTILLFIVGQKFFMDNLTFAGLK